MFDFGHRVVLASLALSASACSLLFEPATNESSNDAAPLDCSSGSRPPTTCLIDSFDTQDTSTWEFYRNGDNKGVEVDTGALVLDMSANGGDVALIASQAHYSLRDSEVVVQVNAVPDASYLNVWSVLTVFSSDVFATNAIEFGCTEGRLVASTSRGEVEGWRELGDVPCNLDDSAFWRISHAGTDISFWHSSNGTDWKSIATTAEGNLNLDDVVVAILLENYSLNRSSSDSSFVIESINP